MHQLGFWTSPGKHELHFKFIIDVEDYFDASMNGGCFALQNMAFVVLPFSVPCSVEMRDAVH